MTGHPRRRSSVYPIYLEVGTRRVFAGALDWPGWCRSGREEGAALQALVAYGPRYVRALGRTAQEFTAPKDESALKATEKLTGDATTDFGAPSIAPSADDRPLDDAEAERLTAILKGTWRAFDRAAQAAVGATLSKGPRGGGRELDAIFRHVLEADAGYIRHIGGKYKLDEGTVAPTDAAELRQAILRALARLIRGELPEHPRRSGSMWSPRYFVRRSAWHALDHAWEIEDRAGAASSGSG